MFITHNLKAGIHQIVAQVTDNNGLENSNPLN